MKKLISLFVPLIAYLFLLIASTNAAGVVCTPIYGGGQSCVTAGQIVVDKKVQNPQTSVFVDNLGPNDPKYVPAQSISFTITVSNTGGTTLSRVKVQDVFPVYVQEILGPGTLDGNVLSFDVLNLSPGESRTFTVSAKVVASDQLPNKTVICEINNDTSKPLQNKAIAIVDGQVEDTAKFCIQKEAVGGPVTKGGLKVFPAPVVPTTPPTGPEVLALIGLLPSGALGYFLRKKSIRG